ncbi:hypothetical protein EVAR_17893_1 [Eumeta japonica]|uniref:Uncharacterized protein n=1 Tax=Eumeta variegata TaxID=151549 RepID=A0A4C1UY59_EUMVA|nr:hypothetical protein EVAR_17893_1 [Eumeta japonica]
MRRFDVGAFGEMHPAQRQVTCRPVQIGLPVSATTIRTAEVETPGPHSLLWCRHSYRQLTLGEAVTRQ